MKFQVFSERSALTDVVTSVQVWEMRNGIRRRHRASFPLFNPLNESSGGSHHFGDFEAAQKQAAEHLQSYLTLTEGDT